MNCEECVHYDYDDEIDAYYCTMDQIGRAFV